MRQSSTIFLLRVGRVRVINGLDESVLVMMLLLISSRNELDVSVTVAGGRGIPAVRGVISLIWLCPAQGRTIAGGRGATAATRDVCGGIGISARGIWEGV